MLGSYPIEDQYTSNHSQKTLSHSSEGTDAIRRCGVQSFLWIILKKRHAVISLGERADFGCHNGDCLVPIWVGVVITYFVEKIK